MLFPDECTLNMDRYENFNSSVLYLIQANGGTAWLGAFHRKESQQNGGQMCMFRARGAPMRMAYIPRLPGTAGAAGVVCGVRF